MSYRCLHRSVGTTLQQRVPGAPASTVSGELSLFGERGDMILDCVPADASNFCDFTDCHAPSFATEFENSHGQFWEVADKNSLAFDFLF